MVCNLASQSIARYALAGGGFSSIETIEPVPTDAVRHIYLNFEDDLSIAPLTLWGADSVLVVEDNPYSGTRSLRGNLASGLAGNDPITGKTRNNSPLNLDIAGITSNANRTWDKLFVRYRLRFDDADNRQSNDTVTTPKLAYFSDTRTTFETGSAIWPVIEPGKGLRSIYRNDGNGSGFNPFPDFNAGAPQGECTDCGLAYDGNWNTVEALFDQQNNTAEFWINGVKFLGYTDATDGVWPVASEYTMDHIRFFHGDNAVWANSVNGTGEKGGFQLDEIEIWEGDPRQGPIYLTGTFAQGNTVTLRTDNLDFGTRASKVVHVFDGVNKAGSTWGRDTSTYWQTTSVLTSDVTVGEMPNSVRWDFKNTTNAVMDQLIPFDVNKRYEQSTARYYNFNIVDSLYQNESGGFNLKTDRWWRTTGFGTANLYIGYQGGDGVSNTSSRIGVENIVGNPGNYYGAGVPSFQWTNERIAFFNSIVPNEATGYCLHYRDKTWLNSDSDPEDLAFDKSLFITKDDTYPGGLGAKAFDQVSNGSGSGVDNVYMYFGYLVIDDEVSGVYVSTLSEISEDWHLDFQLPHDNWTTNSIDILALCPIPAADAYIYIKRQDGSWVSTIGLKAVNN